MVVDSAPFERRCAVRGLSRTDGQITHLPSTVRAGPSRWSRRFVVLGTGYLVLWRFGSLLGVPRRTAVVLALFGFVFHVVFGMGYLLIPSYFERVLAAEWPPPVHL